MVWHHFQFQYFTTQFLCNLIDDFFQAFIDTTNQNLATELRTKDHRIFAGVLNMAIAFVAHTFYYTAVSCLMSRLAPYIPTAKAGGFTALFGKT